MDYPSSLLNPSHNAISALNRARTYSHKARYILSLLRNSLKFHENFQKYKKKINFMSKSLFLT